MLALFVSARNEEHLWPGYETHVELVRVLHVLSHEISSLYASSRCFCEHCTQARGELECSEDDDDLQL